jgi:hypothetical protein
LDPNRFRWSGGRWNVFLVAVVIGGGLTLVIVDGKIWNGYNPLLLVSFGLVFGFLFLKLLSEFGKLKFFLLKLSLLLLLFQEFLAPLLTLNGVRQFSWINERMGDAQRRRQNTHVEFFLEFTGFLFLSQAFPELPFADHPSSSSIGSGFRLRLILEQI